MSSASTTSTPTSFGDLLRYRTVDIVTVTTLGVAFGVVFWGWGKLYEPISGLAVFSFPPSSALLAGPWLIAGVVGGLIVRKPGAAVATELIAASVSALVPGGTQWGSSVLVSGLLQGLGAELIFAIFLYRRFGLGVAALAGMGAAAAAWVFELFYGSSPNILKSLEFNAIYLGAVVVSGAILAGVVGWMLVRALAATGALSRFAAGREARQEV